MKKYLALLLSLVMLMSLVACGGSKKEEPKQEETKTEESTETTETADPAAELKIGLICVHDINSGYDAAHIEGLSGAIKALGIDESQVVYKYNIPEDETCYDMAVDLAEEGCNLIISNSYGHQLYMQEAASEYPDVTFVAATGDTAAPSGLSNFKNIFPYTYESRYVSGIVAGMKLKELMDAGTVTDPHVGMSAHSPMPKWSPVTPHSSWASSPSSPRLTWKSSTPTPGMIPWLRARLPTL